MTVQQGATPLNAERCLWSLSLVNTVASFKALINNPDVPVLSKEQQYHTQTQQNAYFLFCYHYYFYWFSNNCALRSKTASPCFGFFMFFFWQFSRDVLNMLSTRLMICLCSSSPPTLSQTWTFPLAFFTFSRTSSWRRFVVHCAGPFQLVHILLDI